MKDKDPLKLHNQYHGCWWPGDASSQVIISHGMDIIHQNILEWAPEGLTLRGRKTHICVGNLTIIGSDNGLSPGRRQDIIWSKAGILLIWLLGTNFSEILIIILRVSFKKMHFKGLSAKWRPFFLGLNVLTSCNTNLYFKGQINLKLMICWYDMKYVYLSDHRLSGKLWYLQHTCVGDTIVCH